MPEDSPQPLPKTELHELLVDAGEERSEMDKVVEILLDPKNIGHLTEFSSREITAYSVLYSINKEYELPMLQSFLEKFAILRVSKSRQGRKEFVKIMSRQLDMAENQGDPMSGGRFGRMFRRRNPRN